MGPTAAGSLVPKPGSLAIKRESMKCLFLLGHNGNWLPWQKGINTTNYYNFHNLHWTFRGAWMRVRSPLFCIRAVKWQGVRDKIDLNTHLTNAYSATISQLMWWSSNDCWRFEWWFMNNCSACRLLCRNGFNKGFGPQVHSLAETMERKVVIQNNMSGWIWVWSRERVTRRFKHDCSTLHESMRCISTQNFW